MKLVTACGRARFRRCSAAAGSCCTMLFYGARMTLVTTLAALCVASVCLPPLAAAAAEHGPEEAPAHAAGLSQAYRFRYDVEHPDGARSGRSERGDHRAVTGSYSILGADGLQRTVNYIADHLGFRALVDSNEPGVISGEYPPRAVLESVRVERPPVKQQPPRPVAPPTPPPSRRVVVASHLSQYEVKHKDATFRSHVDFGPADHAHDDEGNIIPLPTSRGDDSHHHDGDKDDSPSPSRRRLPAAHRQNPKHKSSSLSSPSASTAGVTPNGGDYREGEDDHPNALSDRRNPDDFARSNSGARPRNGLTKPGATRSHGSPQYEDYVPEKRPPARPIHGDGQEYVDNSRPATIGGELNNELNRQRQEGGDDLEAPDDLRRDARLLLAGDFDAASPVLTLQQQRRRLPLSHTAPAAAGGSPNNDRQLRPQQQQANRRRGPDVDGQRRRAGSGRGLPQQETIGEQVAHSPTLYFNTPKKEEEGGAIITKSHFNPPVRSYPPAVQREEPPSSPPLYGAFDSLRRRQPQPYQVEHQHQHQQQRESDHPDAYSSNEDPAKTTTTLPDRVRAAAGYGKPGKLLSVDVSQPFSKRIGDAIISTASSIAPAQLPLPAGVPFQPYEYGFQGETQGHQQVRDATGKLSDYSVYTSRLF